MEGTLKVLGKSLKTVLDEVHFIVNLYSCPQGKPFRPHLLAPSQGEQLPKSHTLSRHIDNSLSVFIFLKF